MHNFTSVPCQITRNTTLQRIVDKFILQAEKRSGLVLFSPNEVVRETFLQSLQREVGRHLAIIDCDQKVLRLPGATLTGATTSVLLNLDKQCVRQVHLYEQAVTLLRDNGFDPLVGIYLYAGHTGYKNAKNRSPESDYKTAAYARAELFDYFTTASFDQ